MALSLNQSPCVLRWLCVSLSHSPRIPHCQSPRVQCHPILMVSVSTAGRLLRVTSILSPASRDIPSPPPTLVSSQATRRFLPLIPELSNQRWHYQTGNASRGSLPPCHPRAFVTIISHATRGSSLPSPVPSQTTEGSLPLATKLSCLHHWPPDQSPVLPWWQWSNRHPADGSEEDTLKAVNSSDEGNTFEVDLWERQDTQGGWWFCFWWCWDHMLGTILFRCWRLAL